MKCIEVYLTIKASMAERKVGQAAPWAKGAEIGRDLREIQRDIGRFLHKRDSSGHIDKVYIAYRVRGALKSRTEDSQHQTRYHRRRIPSDKIEIEGDIGRYGHQTCFASWPIIMNTFLMDEARLWGLIARSSKVNEISFRIFAVNSEYSTKTSMCKDGGQLSKTASRVRNKSFIVS